MATKSIEMHDDRHRVIAEIQPEMVKAVLRKAASEDYLAEIGECLDFARRAVGWTLDQLASELPPPPNGEKRDPRQVQRWIDGKERTQLDAVFAVDALRGPFVIALANLAARDDSGVQLVTQINIRQKAG